MLFIGRDGDQVAVYDLSLEAADQIEALGDGGSLALPREERDTLLELGVLVPARWGEGTQ